MESVISQRYPNLEVIIINDGSTDSSLLIAEVYAKKYSWIKVYTQENSGASSARNKAFGLSSGDYIQYFDADDIMHQSKISSQMDLLKKLNFNPFVAASGKWVRFNNTIDNIEFHSQITYRNYDNSVQFLKDVWENFHYIIGQSWLISRELHEKVGLWNQNLSVNDDGDFFARVAYYAESILFAAESKVFWRQDNYNSLSKNRTREGMKSYLLVCDRYVDIVKENLDYPGMKQALAMEYSTCIYRSYPQHMDIVKEAEEAINNLGFEEPFPMPTWKFRLSTKVIGFYPTARLFNLKDKLINNIRKWKALR